MEESPMGKGEAAAIEAGWFRVQNPAQTAHPNLQSVPISFLIHPGPVAMSAFQDRDNFVEIGRRWNIDRIKSSVPDTELLLPPFVRAAEGLQVVPMLLKARFILTDQNHIRRMTASSHDPLEVEELFAFGRRGVDNITIGDTSLEEGGILQPKGVWAERWHGISPQRLGGMTMPIGVIEIEGDSHHFATITRGSRTSDLLVAFVRTTQRASVVLFSNCTFGMRECDW
jgi:hypothetical protein